MDEPEDIGTPAEEAGNDVESPEPSDDDLDGPRTEDIDAQIRKARMRTWLIGAGVLLAIGIVLGLVFLGGDDDADRASDDSGGTEATSSVETSGSALNGGVTSRETDTVTPDDGDGDQDDGDTDADGTDATGHDFVDAGMVAYRVATDIWVALEDGSDARTVVQLPVGGYALSPDGTVLAVTDAFSETLSLIDVETGEPLGIGSALPTDPVWAADSGSLLFERRNADNLREVALVARDGGDVTTFALGHSAYARGDGDGHGAIVREGSEIDEHAIDLLDSTGPTRLRANDRILDFVWEKDLLVFACQDADGRSRIRIRSLDDASESVLVKPLREDSVMVGYAALMLSPDGTVLAYAASGDDGYSRLFVISAAGGDPKELSIRRDAYPLRWTSDGDYLLFIEGNAFQGEETNLMRVRPSGMGREVLIEGAGL